MVTTTCQFSEPITWENILPATETDIWNFSKITCESENNIFTLIQNPETGAEFYIEKTLNYGDAIIIWFFTLFTFYLIFKITYNFFWKK